MHAAIAGFVPARDSPFGGSIELLTAPLSARDVNAVYTCHPPRSHRQAGPASSPAEAVFLRGPMIFFGPQSSDGVSLPAEPISRRGLFMTIQAATPYLILGG